MVAGRQPRPADRDSGGHDRPDPPSDPGGRFPATLDDARGPRRRGGHRGGRFGPAHGRHRHRRTGPAGPDRGRVRRGLRRRGAAAGLLGRPGLPAGGREPGRPFDRAGVAGRTVPGGPGRVVPPGGAAAAAGRTGRASRPLRGGAPGHRRFRPPGPPGRGRGRDRLLADRLHHGGDRVVRGDAGHSGPAAGRCRCAAEHPGGDPDLRRRGGPGPHVPPVRGPAAGRQGLGHPGPGDPAVRWGPAAPVPPGRGGCGTGRNRHRGRLCRPGHHHRGRGPRRPGGERGPLPPGDRVHARPGPAHGPRRHRPLHLRCRAALRLRAAGPGGPERAGLHPPRRCGAVCGIPLPAAGTGDPRRCAVRDRIPDPHRHGRVCLGRGQSGPVAQWRRRDRRLCQRPAGRHQPQAGRAGPTGERGPLPGAGRGIAGCGGPLRPGLPLRVRLSAGGGIRLRPGRADRSLDPRDDPSGGPGVRGAARPRGPGPRGDGPEPRPLPSPRHQGRRDRVGGIAPLHHPFGHRGARGDPRPGPQHHRTPRPAQGPGRERAAVPDHRRAGDRHHRCVRCRWGHRVPVTRHRGRHRLSAGGADRPVLARPRPSR